MSKKAMLLALSVVAAALVAMPAAASATPAHIDVPETFNIAGGGTTTLEQADGTKVQCHNGLSGHGQFDTTTTGTVNYILFHGCTTSTIFGNVSCTTHDAGNHPSGTITTTSLPFHLIDLGTHAGVLLTPNAATGTFAHFTCAGINKTVTGNGVIGTITSPTCGGTSNVANLSFEQAATGTQKHSTFTGVPYNLESGGQKAAQEGTGSINFGAARTINCTTP